MRHNKLEVAWAAGLFEGEGCFSPVTVRGRVYPRASLGMSDEDVVLRFQRAVDCGHIRHERREPARKNLFRWEVQARYEFDRFISLMRPHLGERRLHALDEMLAKSSPRIRRSFSRERS